MSRKQKVAIEEKANVEACSSASSVTPSVMISMGGGVGGVGWGEWGGRGRDNQA